MALKKAGGMWVSGERFFDREIELATLADRVHNGTHSLITAQRRMGKTSLVRELLRRLEEEGLFNTIFVDLEDAPTPADAVAEIAARSTAAQGAWRQIQSVFDTALQGIADRVDAVGVPELQVKLRAGMDAGNWRRKGDAVFAALAANEQPLVLALDELPMLVNRLLKGHDHRITSERIEVAEEFLSWLRKNGQEYPGRVCLLVSGSVGLEPILRQAGLSAQANIFVPFELKPWDEETAIACLGELADGSGLVLSEAVRREMCRRLRRQVPHHVQQFFGCLEEDLRRVRQREASTNDVNRVYAAEMLGVRGQMDLEHYESRLKFVLGPNGHRAAFELLNEAAVNGGLLLGEAINQCATYIGVSVDNDAGAVSALIGDVLRVLEHDGYLEKVGPDYRFVSGLLEDWWRTHRASHHVPIADRVSTRST